MSKYSAFKNNVLETFETLKNPSSVADEYYIPIYDKNFILIAKLKPIRRNYSFEEIMHLMNWRNQNREAFFTWIHSTVESTKKWLDEQILHRPDRILFFAEDLEGRPMGQIGLTNCDFEKGSCELDNWIKDQTSKISGGMMSAIQSLMDWTFFTLEAESICARVFIGNEAIIKKHKQNGLVVTSRIPLKKVEEGEIVRWVELEKNLSENPDTFYMILAIEKKGYHRLNHPESKT